MSPLCCKNWIRRPLWELLQILGINKKEQDHPVHYVICLINKALHMAVIKRRGLEIFPVYYGCDPRLLSKKNRTKRNLWLFDSPPTRTRCIYPETWNVSDNSVCIFHLVQCEVHGWDLKKGYGFLDGLHVDIHVYISTDWVKWNIPKHITIVLLSLLQLW